jgi:glycosidase
MHIIRTLLLAGVCLLPLYQLNAQVVWAEPAFPTVDDEVTIYFDASQGTAGLKDCDCDVYIHTGVITNASNGPSDWKNVQMTWGVANPNWQLDPVPGEPNLYTYTISPSIAEFYNITGATTVLELAMVFRNANGSLEGKAQGGLDIYYPVYPDDFPFSSILLAPSQASLVAENGTDILIRAASSELSELTILDNGIPVHTANGISFTYNLPVSGAGTHFVELIFDNGTEQSTQSFSYVIPNTQQTAPLPAGAEPGILLHGDTAMTLALYAPGKDHVFVLGSFNNYIPDTSYQMNLSPDGSTWWLRIEGLETGETYLFQYLVDGSLKIADPYSTLILDPANDPFIPAITFPNLPQYPTGLTEGFLTVIQPGAPQYEWQHNDFVPPPKAELTVYELLLRDFIDRHDYETLIDTLNYLVELGVNAIELMPIQQFEGNISWGYNPSFHMALDKYYGTANEFKRFVDTCHALGIAVIVDVVYNHAFGQCPLVQLYFDGKPTLESPWFNRDATHPFNVGYDFNHESEATKFYVKKVMKHWIEEFRLDGFRYDLSKGFTQVNNPDNVGAWGQYDASRIAILKDYADSNWESNPDFYVMLEHFADNNEELELAEYGMMLWGNLHGIYTNSARGVATNLNGINYQVRNFPEPDLLMYMESHDEERILYSCLQQGVQTNPAHNIRQLEVAIRRIELNSNFFYPVPGPKMLWQFGELGYDVPINFNGRTGPKPIRWNYLEDDNRRRLYGVTSSLINLRRDYPVFHTTDYDLRISGLNPQFRVKSIHLNSPDMNVTVLGNFHIFEFPITPYFQHTGTWYEYYTGDTLVVEDVLEPIDLLPGEYRLYTDVQLPPPPMGYITTVGVAEAQHIDLGLKIFPNPVRGQGNLQYELDAPGEVRIDLFSLQGEWLESLYEGRQPAGPHQQEIRTGHLPAGTYLIAVRLGNLMQSVKLVVM